MSETSSAKSALTSAAEVLAAERLAILKQRQVRLGAEAGGAEEGQTDGGFVGLALSGGGIRSATFSLGVLQWLSSKLPNQKRRIIDFVDYLSTVSGGGYIGSWFLANRLRVAEKSQEQTAAATDTSFVNRADSPFVGYLRRFSHYLAPTSGLMSGDTWTMVAVWLRNTLLIQAMIFCAVALVMWVARLWLVGLHEMSGVKPLPGLGALFIVPILFGLSLAAWRSRRELSLFVEDDQTKVTENLKGGDPATQEKVQRRIVLPTILTSLVLTLAMWWRVEQNPQSMIEWLTGYKPTSIILDPAVILACLYMGAWAFRLVRVADDSKEPRGWLTHGLVFAGITLANLALLYVLEELFRVLHGIKPAGIEHLGMALAAVIGPALVSFCYSLIVILGIGLMGRRLRDKLREWWSRVYAWLMIYSVALLAVTSLAILGPLNQR
ncbi:MAG TPA: patatin-like phospholipase family protein [Prosthecobacter sp.]|nr:patatin-like phospholipase family protein [Prosthecobacter sp.]